MYGRVAFMGGNVVCLAEGGGGECCLAGETLGAVAIRGAVIAATDIAEWGVGLAGRSCGADVLGKMGLVVRLIVGAFASVGMIVVVKCPRRAAFRGCLVGAGR